MRLGTEEQRGKKKKRQGEKREYELTSGKK